MNVADEPGHSAVPDTEPQRLSGEQLSEILRLLGDVDRVELKLTVPDSQRGSTMTALGIDPLDAEIRQVFFFDTPDLSLQRHGVVVRARRVQRRDDDSVVKLRPVVPDEVPAATRRLAEFSTEVDAMPGGFVCSGSLRGRVGASKVADVAAGRRPVRKLFGKEQRALYARHAPEGTELDALTPLGPVTVFKLKLSPPDLGRRLVVEQWHYPDGSRILELSTKCAPADAFRVAAETKSFLWEHGISLSGEQQAKTRTALEYFAGALDRP